MPIRFIWTAGALALILSAFSSASYSQPAPRGEAVEVEGGLLAPDQRPRFRAYVLEHRRPSYRYERQVAVGVVLPEDVTYYDIPTEFGVRTYRYAIINDRTVLVDPRTRTVVQVLE